MPGSSYDGSSLSISPAAISQIKSGQASPTAGVLYQGGYVAQNHYVTKTKRRNKSGKRKDPSATTMAKLRERAAAAVGKKAGQ
jgi:hypothetical protein